MKLMLLLLVPAILSADEHWLTLQSGPFEVVTNAGEKPGRDAMNTLEQLRWALSKTLGKEDLKSLWPIRILVIKPGKGAGAVEPEVKLARDNYVASVTSFGEETLGGVTRILIDSNAGPLPLNIDLGLPTLFSTLQVEGTHVTLGAKPAHPDRDWARVQLLSVDPAYAGRLRVLIGNLQLGVDPEPAYKNAFEKTQQQIEAQLNKYIESGQYGTIPVNSRPLDARRDLRVKAAEPGEAELLLADNLLAHGSPNAKGAYEAILQHQPQSPEALEGLGRFEDAVKAGSKSAHAALEAAKVAKDPAVKKAGLQKAAQLNPLWSEPHALLSELETGLLHKVAEMKTAAQLAPRNSAYWEELARLQENASQFVDAGKSWAAAERAAKTSAEREQIHQARLGTEQARLDAQDAARRAEARKKQQEIEDLKARALSDIRSFEAKANAKASEGLSPLDPNQKLEMYKEDIPVKLTGSLVQVDCLGKHARLHIEDAQKVSSQFLVQDPKHVVILGGGERALGCGAQKPARPIVIEYQAKPDKKLGTVGEVTEIDFR